MFTIKMAIRAAGLLVYRVVNGSNEYLLLQASYPPHHWTPPKGHVDPGEDEWQAALRETKEEANIDSSLLDIHKDFCHVQHYTTNKGPKTVSYWLAHLKTYDVQLSHEHQNWKWLSLEPAIDIVKFPEMVEMLNKAEEYLKLKKN
ncbi:Bis(5'-nucleosyl)-tetraphosphatase [asymmetrical] [Aphelenchoides bicaudatus]|nr:Bis(5'-nucleosyl)-tetraphosphatase [asymmetrical] [Aphelenchoides bicaudatus]